MAADASGHRPAHDTLLADLQSTNAREWCGTRYRSYDPIDNTYQPYYGGGPRRNCEAQGGMQTAPVQKVADMSDAVQPDENARWCMERYSSYRIEDNTYQPFTGQRKQCPGPASQSASNLVGGRASVIQF